MEAEVLLRPLGPVHRLVGALQQRLGRGAVAGEERAADGDAHGEEHRAHVEGLGELLR